MQDIQHGEHAACFSNGISASMQQTKLRPMERNPDGYLFIKHKVLPRLLELGVSEKDVNALNEDNVRRFFENK